MLPTNRPPTHPGEMLLKEFLEPLGVSQVEAAERMNIPFQRLNAIVKAAGASAPIPRCCWQRSPAGTPRSGSAFKPSGTCGTRSRTAHSDPRCRPCQRPPDGDRLRLKQAIAISEGKG